MCARVLVGRGAPLACAALALLALAAAAASDGKRAESEFMSPMPFVLGSRYGRSQPRLISPRNDRFFMSSRYGKRSEPLSPRLLCTPTGVHALYRCAPATPTPAPAVHNHQHNNNRISAEERRISAEERELGEDE